MEIYGVLFDIRQLNEAVVRRKLNMTQSRHVISSAIFPSCFLAWKNVSGRADCLFVICVSSSLFDLFMLFIGDDILGVRHGVVTWPWRRGQLFSAFSD